ncbi:MAG TPA: hypothetical protein VMW51_11315, partial [Terriglobia bacterium]|nr:hypothetical protein [Terriglobia bacterium]
MLFSKSPALPLTTGQNGGHHKAPQINVLSHEPRRKVLTGGLATLLSRHPSLPPLIAGQNVAATRHDKVPRLSVLSHEPRRKAFRGGFRSLFLKTPPPQPLIVGRD